MFSGRQQRKYYMYLGNKLSGNSLNSEGGASTKSLNPGSGASMKSPNPAGGNNSISSLPEGTDELGRAGAISI